MWGGALNEWHLPRAQATIYLDDFTEENGATAAVEGTQLEAIYPWDSEEFMKRKVQGVGEERLDTG